MNKLKMVVLGTCVGMGCGLLSDGLGLDIRAGIGLTMILVPFAACLLLIVDAMQDR